MLLSCEHPTASLSKTLLAQFPMEWSKWGAWTYLLDEIQNFVIALSSSKAIRHPLHIAQRWHRHRTNVPMFLTECCAVPSTQKTPKISAFCACCSRQLRLCLGQLWSDRFQCNSCWYDVCLSVTKQEDVYLLNNLGVVLRWHNGKGSIDKCSGRTSS